MMQKFITKLAPIAALAGAALVAGCNGMNVNISNDDGVPLSELDMTGAAPTELVLAGPDKVIVSTGPELDIDVSGDDAAVDALRFTLEDAALTIGRKNDSSSDMGTATVRVTVPSLTALTLAGSGAIEAASLTKDAEVTIAGSGKAWVKRIDATTLDLTIAGSGDFQTAGKVETLDMTIAGSGKARMADLAVGNADISVAGSGDAEFASDGNVEANIMGSGTITVNGRANCTVNSMGSGTLNCRNVSADRQRTPSPAPTAPVAPAAPDSPEAGTAPEAP